MVQRYAALLLLLLAGCDPFAASAPPEAGAPPVAVVRQSPEDVVRGFLEAWNRLELPAMYGYVSPPSRERYPYDIFERRYTVAQDAIGFSGITYRIDRVALQGVTAAVYYDAELQSPLFGSIPDPDRIMRLVQVDNGWQIAWTPMDIMNGLASEVSMQVLSRFPPRASIYDRNGDFVVQEGGTIVTISVVQQDMNDVEGCITLLARLMLRPRLDIARLFQNYNDDTFFYVGELDVDQYNLERGNLEDLCGLADESQFRKVTQYQGRRYVGQGTAAHITGYIAPIPADRLAQFQAQGYQAGDIVGISGVEFWYQTELAGRPERFLRMAEIGGTVIRELGGTSGTDTFPVQLTIDMGLQNATSRAIHEAFLYAANNWAPRASGAAAVVLDVNSGAILALASYPTFDPAVFNPDSSYVDPGTIIAGLVNSPLRPLVNKAVQEQYAPGSVYKIFTLIAADAESLWNPAELFNCELLWYGGERFGDAREFRQDWRVVDELPAAGEITMSEALTASCNPFFWEMGALMFRRSASIQSDYDSLFGFGSRTGLSLLGQEAAGNLARPSNIASAINNAIGQGDVQVTALQMAAAVTAVANRGTLYAPYIVQQVGGLEDTALREEARPRVVRTLEIPAEVFDRAWEGMCQVPTNRNLGTSWRIFNGSEVPPAYSSCGKTGTAQAGTAESGVPPNAWYVAFAPADNPQIAIAVVVPTSREGSEVAAPITRRILDYYFNAPVAPFPEWWEEDYVPVRPPEGVSG
ncbi:MAG: penicillin-binding transpeptidase domain-containing protein [Anaerolineae bacterium]|jgi:penicillin-binding protein 2|nr:penicillin-binding transpeptidase domain-containing protein [Anaerolineae bacterium]